MAFRMRHLLTTHPERMLWENLHTPQNIVVPVGLRHIPPGTKLYLPSASLSLHFPDVTLSSVDVPMILEPPHERRVGARRRAAGPSGDTSGSEKIEICLLSENYDAGRPSSSSFAADSESFIAPALHTHSRDDLIGAPYTPHHIIMDAFYYLSAPIPSQEPTSESSSPSEVLEVFVDQDTFGFIGCTRDASSRHDLRARLSPLQAILTGTS
ncbi:hypothetical protein GSI_07536 [Ganoderma sinense ZZ0214-1]|uniref:Uncharacterized protein n=1 Tax=Ganoderma sinense ZZ0214-1 TaxID=1077348 RepID=A0A2G8S9B3_9APHY|nr:hypothetical protein GSI_07536 [Ganoderma sinense ZZ0214-1]